MSKSSISCSVAGQIDHENQPGSKPWTLAVIKKTYIDISDLSENFTTFIKTVKGMFIIYLIKKYTDR